MAKETNTKFPMTSEEAADAIQDILTDWAEQNGAAGRVELTLGSFRTNLTAGRTAR